MHVLKTELWNLAKLILSVFFFHWIKRLFQLMVCITLIEQRRSSAILHIHVYLQVNVWMWPLLRNISPECIVSFGYQCLFAVKNRRPSKIIQNYWRPRFSFFYSFYVLACRRGFYNGSLIVPIQKKVYWCINIFLHL